MPVFHDCQRCTACCRWPGQVRLTNDEIARIAAFLQLGEHDFIQRHTRLQHDRHGLALQEQSDGACVFLITNRCTIQAVKPQQCRDFPNLWKYPAAEQYCQAVAHEVSESEYVRLVAQATERAPEVVRAILTQNGETS